jgi:hypothetical protein
MRKKIRSITLVFLFLIGTFTVFSQGFGGKGSKYFLAGIGLSEHLHNYPQNNKGYKGWMSPTAFNVSAQLEFGIHQYVGLGFHVGFDVTPNLGASGVYYNGNYPVVGSSGYAGFAIPIGVQCNFHFLQLIADKAGKSFADKLDVYAGLSAGSGPAFAVAKSNYKDAPYFYESEVGFLFYAGPHAGIRYFFKDNLGVYAEAGYGKSYVNGGFVFKL